VRLRVLSGADVETALDGDALVDALAGAFVRLSEGRVSMPTRVGVDVPGRGSVLLMGAHRHDADSLAVKLVSLYAHQAPGGPPAHQAAIVVFDAHTGTPTALMDGTAITALRTAAASRLATRLLARADARSLAVVGTGVQARAHVRALARERDFASIRIGGRRADAAAALAAELHIETGAPVAAADSIEAAVHGADVVCVATAAQEPVLERDWLAAGAHVNSVGFTTSGRELAPAVVRDALVVVESRAAALAPAPAGSTDLLWAIRDGVIDEGHLHAELGELVSGARPGRTAGDQLTLYKSVGVGIEDDAAAALALEGARERGLGTDVEL
jgi:ornithine cyclodeaminase/alanine dehydrogenase-like protein (mu-crystallin family)